MTLRIALRGLATVIISGWGLLWLPDVAQAELAASLYSGISRTRASDVNLSLPGNTQLRFHDVSWDDKSLENPIYWGVRLVYWLPQSPHWGLALDFTHAKVHADLARTVTVTGTRQGATVNTREPLASNFDKLAMSHGLNFLSFNGLYRWPEWRCWRPFAGVGGGIVYPHVEVQTGNSYTDEYQISGWTLNAMAGILYALSRSFAIFAEYKLSYADIHANLNGGGELQTQLWTHHINLGVTYYFSVGD